jgi:hypothetical protein
MFVAYHFDQPFHHQPQDKPQQPPFSVLCECRRFRSKSDLASRIPSCLANLPPPNRVHLRCGLVVSHSVAPDHASQHRPYSVLLVLSRFNNAGLSLAVISAPWRTRVASPRRPVRGCQASHTGRARGRAARRSAPTNPNRGYRSKEILRFNPIAAPAFSSLTSTSVIVRRIVRGPAIARRARRSEATCSER